LNRQSTGLSFLALALMIGSSVGCAVKADSVQLQQQWPAGTDPQVVGKRIAENLLPRAIPKKPITYPEICTAYGSLRFAAATKDKDLLEKIVARYAVMLTPEGKHLIQHPSGVDASVFAILPLEIYRQTGDQRYLDVGKDFAAAQWDKTIAADKFHFTPKDALNAGVPADLSWQTRYWLDDMFMIIALETETYRVTKDPVYLDRAATEMSAYIDKLQQPSGIFYHSNDPGLFYWGRANGWMSAGMAELLSEMPATHPLRPKIMESYKKFMTALLKVQAEDGMWRQVLDDPKAWKESSCTGMFIFGMARGIKNGWLDAATFQEPIHKAWVTLVTQYLDENANVKEVCVGTNRGTDEDFYLKRSRAVGDLHGQAAVIWAAYALTDLQAMP
jgi:unsaturated rhamnogalacturonyl hydrolase